MATRRNALQLYDAQVKKFQEAKEGAIDAWQMLPEGAEKDARELLSGTVSTAELKRRGRPFARLGGKMARYDPRNPARAQSSRRASVRTPRLPINRQSGRLLSALEMRDAKAPGALSAKSVGFDKSRAGRSIFVLSPEGTTRMVARGFWTELKKRWRQRNNAFRTVFVRKQRKAMTD